MSSDPLPALRALCRQRPPAQAMAACRAHLAQHPTSAEGWLLLAQAQLDLTALGPAAESLTRAAALAPDLAQAPEFRQTWAAVEASRLTLEATALKKQGAGTEALRRLEQAAELVPDRPWTLNNLAELHFSLGETELALELFRQAADHPAGSHRVAHSNLLLALLHSDRTTPEEVLAEHRRWVARHAPVTAPRPAMLDPNPQRRIRLGYSSPDLRAHPVAMFLEGVLAHHDRTRFEVTCYADGGAPDALTRRLQGYGHRWVEASALGPQQLFERIRADQIDLLFDLAVHSGFNRQRLFALRPAPVQLTWLGYAGTTGSPAIDYRVTDAVVDPPGLTEAHFTERLLRLPEVLWTFTPFGSRPELPPRPEGNRLRIGTATRLAKVSPGCLDLWASLFRELPQATLCLASEPFGDAAIVHRWTERLLARGLRPEQIELRPAQGYDDYLRFLGSLDLGLDTLPFNGGTTVCQTLWMGTPVVALAGRTSAARVGASILHALGRPEWVAGSAAEWLEAARRLLASPPERSALQAQFAACTLGNAARFTAQFEESLGQVFAAACRS